MIPASWTIQGTGNFSGAGITDILWRNSTGTGLNGSADILWRNANGDVVVWFLNGGTIAFSSDLGVIPASWTLQP